MIRTVDRASIPEPVVRICERLRDGGHGAWIVGGCVRDLLLGRDVSDWDVATSARPEQVGRIFRRVIPTGIDHGTVTVLHRGVPYEVTTLRGEGGYSDGRRPDSVFFVDEIDRDLARRDFTVNAIAYDPLTDRLVDPFGGLADLDRAVIRAVGDPRERFAEDGLRVLRGARFVATLEFDLAEDTAAAIPGALSTFRMVSHERVRDEWLKAMKAQRPSRAFDVMRETGILGVTLPELVRQHGCEQNRWHAYDVWRHTMECLDLCPGDPIERLAALLHDVGKPATRERSDRTGDWTFYRHEVVGAEIADRWLHAFRFSREERRRVVHLVLHHLVCYSPSWSDAAVRRFARRVGEDEIEPLLRLARADVLAKGRDVNDELRDLSELEERLRALLAAGAALSVRDLALSGRDVMELLDRPAGPHVGRLLHQLLERVIEDPALNTRERLTPLLRELADAEGGA